MRAARQGTALRHALQTTMNVSSHCKLLHGINNEGIGIQTLTVAECVVISFHATDSPSSLLLRAILKAQILKNQLAHLWYNATHPESLKLPTCRITECTSVPSTYVRRTRKSRSAACKHTQEPPEQIHHCFMSKGRIRPTANIGLAGSCSRPAPGSCRGSHQQTQRQVGTC